MDPVRKALDPLEMFLYILLRDYLTSGQVEEIMEGHVENVPEGRDVIQYSNPYVVQHVEDLIIRLRGSNGQN